MTTDFGNYPLPSYNLVDTPNEYQRTRDMPNYEKQIPGCKHYKSPYPISLPM